MEKVGNLPKAIDLVSKSGFKSRSDLSNWLLALTMLLVQEQFIKSCSKCSVSRMHVYWERLG